MGKSVPTFTILIERMKLDWNEYKDTLREKEKESYNKLWTKVKKHSSACQYLARMDPMDSIFFSIVLEHQLELRKLRYLFDR